MMFNLFKKKPTLEPTLKPAPRCSKITVSLKGTSTPVEFNAPDPDTQLVLEVIDDTVWVRAKHKDYLGRATLALYMTNDIAGATFDYAYATDLQS